MNVANVVWEMRSFEIEPCDTIFCFDGTFGAFTGLTIPHSNSIILTDPIEIEGFLLVSADDIDIETTIAFMT